MFIVTLLYVYPLNHSLYRNYTAGICWRLGAVFVLYGSRLSSIIPPGFFSGVELQTCLISSAYFPQITTIDFHKYLYSMSCELYYIGSSAKEVPWRGAAPLLPPPPPSPPSSGLRHFASSSLTCWMCSASVSVVSSFPVVVCPLGVQRRALLSVKVNALGFVFISVFFGSLRARKERSPWRVVLVLTCLFALSADRDYAPFFGVYPSWLSVSPSLWPLVCWSHSGSVGVSWRRRALWTPAHPWRSSAAVPCTARLCCPPAAIRMLVAFHAQTPQD